MASSEEAISSGDPEVIKKRRSTIQEMMTNIFGFSSLAKMQEESSKKALAKQLRQEEELQKQEAGAVAKAEEEKIERANVERELLNLAKRKREEMQAVLQANVERGLLNLAKLQEVHGAVDANTAVQEDTAMDPEEVRTKKQASVTEADTTNKSVAATVAATVDVPEEVRTEKQHSAKMIMKERQAKMALNGQPEAEVEVTMKANDEQTEEKKVGVLTRRAHQLELTQYLEVGQLRTTKKKLDARILDVNLEPENILKRHAEAAVVKKGGAKVKAMKKVKKAPSDVKAKKGAAKPKYMVAKPKKVAKKFEDNTAAKNVDANEKNNLTRIDLLAKRGLRGISAEGRTKVAKEITAQEYNDAWIVLIHLEQSVRLQEKQVMKLVPKRIKVKLSMYDWVVDHLVIGGRVSNFPISYDGNYEVPIVPYGPLGRLIMLHYHDKHHREVDTVVAVARADVWVVKARKLAAEWDNKCKICLIKRQKLAGQVMGDLPSFRSEVKPAWTSVNMDLFGPYIIRDDCVKRGPRIYKKVWGVIFTCTLTRGVHLDVAMDYSTESVLHTIRRLMAAKGDVKLIISDPGSQLKGANKELISWRKDWDEQMLVRFGAKKSLDWLFIMPDSQHQNGAAEVMIKMVKGVKKAFLKSMGEQVLSLNEMSTMMAEISNLVNQRPIGVKPNTNTHPEFLSPNSLYLGRCSDRISSGPFQSGQMFNDDPKHARDRFQLVQAITNQFWKNWIKLYFPSLLLRHKWHTSRRNLKVEDICLLQDESLFRSEWRMAKVMEVYPDKTGTVRNVLVQVKPIQDGSSKYKSSQGYQVKRHVSKLLLLVPAEDQESNEKEDDVEVERVILEDDVEVKKVMLEDDVEEERVILDEDDVCDAMAPSVSSSYNSPDVKKQDEVAKQDGEVDKEPGGNVAARRRSPRFGHTIA